MQVLLKDKKLILIFASIVLFTLIIRLINLNSLPVFADEAIYVRWSQVMRAESTLRFLPLSDGKQPLFMWITIPFLKVINDPLIAGRVVSVLSGVGTVVGVFALSYLLFNSKKVSLIASFLYSIIPFSFFFDRLALVDSLLTFFSVWSVFFAVLTIKTLRLDLAMITGFFLGSAFLTKSPAIFIAILIPFLLVILKKENLSFKELSKIFALFGVIYIISFGIQSILRLGPNYHLIDSRNQDYVYPLAHLLTSPTDPLISHLRDVRSWFLYLLPMFSLLLLPFIPFKKYLNQLLFLSVLFVIPIVIESALAKAFTARYILFTIPFVIIFLSTAFLSQTGFKQKIIYAIAALVVAFSFFQNFLFATNPQKAFLPVGERSGYLEDWTAGYGIKEVADYIRNQQNSDPSQKIVVGTEGYFGTLPDGLQIYLNDLREVVVIGIGLGIEKLPESLSESKKANNKTYLVINSTRLLEDPEKLGLTKIAAYPKAVKLNGKREELLFFEVK